jgi:cyclopropane-fatty-acyl-phospholipid synthase
LEEASRHKIERICQLLELGPNDHLLEIGTGWGGFALHAAKNYGCRITTTTISQQQYDMAVERIAQADLSDRIKVLRVDYRDLEGQYDKIVSIEMIEAVGHHYYDAYFGQCSRLLKPDGLMLLQAITIGDWFFDAHTRTVDFIKRYIFPGSCIPSVTAMAESLARESDMRIVDLRDIGPHYARTLRIWRERFFEQIDQVRDQGFNEEFIRMWAFYLCYCEAGFAERYIGDAQILLAKPQNRRHAEFA